MTHPFAFVWPYVWFIAAVCLLATVYEHAHWSVFACLFWLVLRETQRPES
jgi:hypothetical protein